MVPDSLGGKQMRLSAILKDYGLNLEETKLVRHPLNKKDVRDVYAKGGLSFVEAYQSSQSKRVFDNCKYIVTFMGTVGTQSRFVGVYKILEMIDGPKVREYMPVGYPYEEHFDENHVYYRMERTDIMIDLVNRLIIDWPSPRSWFNWASTEKEVLSILSSEEIEFPGYENLILTYNELSNIVDGDERYKKWADALSNVNGIYLICDTKNNMQYVGSTYNDEGILGRWTNYIHTLDGGDVGIKAHLQKYPNAYLDFQFTILRILPKPIEMKAAVEIETLYKRKLGTRNEISGLNRN